MDFIRNREPVATVALVEALLALILAFGVDLSADQVATVIAFTSVLLGWAVRREVSPVGRE